MILLKHPAGQLQNHYGGTHPPSWLPGFKRQNPVKGKLIVQRYRTPGNNQSTRNENQRIKTSAELHLKELCTPEISLNMLKITETTKENKNLKNTVKKIKMKKIIIEIKKK